MTELERRAARILLALSPTAEARVELGAYRYLLGETPPEFVGLLFEDPALLAHTGSRLAREIVLSGAERRLERPALERELRARVAAWRRMFRTESERLGLSITLETVRDERRAALARAAEHADALIVEPAALGDALEIWSALRPDAPLRTLLVTPSRRLAGDIAVVTDARESDEEAHSALSAGLRLARRTGARLTVLDVGRAEDARAVRDVLARRLAARGVRLSGYESLAARLDAGTLAARAARAHLLVLAAAASGDLTLVAGVAARFRGALMLLRGPGHREGL